MSSAKSPNRREILMAAAALSAGSAAFASAPETPAEEPDLTGKSILITGCSSGFGRLGAEYYAARGARVFATMRNLPRPEAEELAVVAGTYNLPIEIIEIDVTSDAQIADGVAAALDMAGGHIDVLINNAGLGITGPVEVQDMAATQLAFDTNVYGPHRMVRALLPSMRRAGRGQIFSISSQLGRLVVPGAGHYSATKFALEAMSEQLAYELVPNGIDVTIIQPGGYPTKVWVNRNRYTAALKARTGEERLDGYPTLAEGMGKEDGSGRNTDPMDIPRAIAEIIAMQPGTRPLRRAVHPSFRPQERVNAACREAQLAFLGESMFGSWVVQAQD